MLALGVLLLVLATSNVQADPPTPPKSKSLDEELLKGLGDDPVGNLKPKPKQADKTDPKQEEPKPADKKPARPQDDLDKQLLEGLGGEGEDIGEDPLSRIGKQMRQASTLIGKSKAGEETQELQKRVLSDIDRLIKLARQQQSQQSSSSSKQQQQTAQRQQVKQAQPKPGPGDGNNPAKNSGDNRDRGGKPELARMDPALRAEVIKRIWGNLPDKEREQMLQNWEENFLPKYELLIEEYFKSLAERQEKRAGGR